MQLIEHCNDTQVRGLVIRMMPSGYYSAYEVTLLCTQIWVVRYYSPTLIGYSPISGALCAFEIIKLILPAENIQVTHNVCFYYKRDEYACDHIDGHHIVPT